MKRIFLTVGSLLLLTLLFTSTSWAQANVVGQWTTLATQMPMNPVHAALMNNGKVVVISGSGWVAGNTNLLAGVWDPATDTVTQQNISWDMWCNGAVFLPDGRLFVDSGTIQYDPFEGSVQTATFNPLTGLFTNMQNMAHGRWYPTVTALGNGSVLAFSGLDENGNTNFTTEIYTVGSGWTSPVAAPWTPPLYPWMHLLPNGNVFYSGSTPVSSIFNPTTGTWTTNVATTNFGGTRTYGSSVLLPLTPANGFKPVVMIFGGANPATATTELIDLSVAQPAWKYGPSMSQARIEMSTVILPTGKVLALGGSVNDEDSTTAGLNTDLYDPVANTFSSAGTASYPRLYHSVALLLPDATVWVAGSNPERGTYEPHMEIYSPAYLYTTNGSGQVVAATRPTITSVNSTTWSYGGAFQVQTPNASTITSAVLVRPGADTHAFNQDQRMVGLSFTAGSGVLNVTAPSSGNIAPPGYYMLFLVNSSGVPSVATFVQIQSSTSGTNPPSGTIVSPSGNVTVGAGQSVNFSGAGTDTNGTITSYSWVLPGGTPSSSSLQNPGPVTYSTTGTYVASLTVTDSNGLTDPNPPTRTITVVPGFTLAATPASQSVTQGSSTTFTATVTPGTGFTSSVPLTVSGLPTGATGTFSPSSLKSGNSTLTVTTLSSTTTGTYPLTISGTSGSLTETATVNLVVNGPSSFTLAATPASQTIVVGNSTTFTPAVTGSGGFSGAVTFTVSGLPTGASATFSPTSVTGSGSTTMTVTTVATTPTGTSTLTITGTSGSIKQTATVTLTVNATVTPASVDSTYVTVGACNAPAQSCTTYDGGTIPKGDAILIVASWGGTTSTATLTDSAGNTYVTISGPTNDSVGTNRTEAWIAKSNIGAVTSATVTLNVPASGPQILVWMVPLKNVDPNTPIDTNVTHTSTGSGTTMASGTSGITSAVASEMIWGVFLEDNYSATYAAGTGFTSISGQEDVSLLEYKNVTQTGVQSATGTNGNGTNNWVGLVFGLRAAGQAQSPTLTSLAVTPANPSIASGGTEQFTATGTYSDGSTKNLTSTVTWSSGTPTVASIAAGGLATGIAGGTSTIQATSGSISGSTVLTVTSTANFTLAATPSSQTVTQGGSTTYTATTTATGGFTGAVAFTVSGLPTGATGTFSPTSVTGSGSSTLTVQTAATTPSGSSTLTITGTSGTLVKTATVTLVVNAAPNFTLAATPTSQTVIQGASTTYTPTATATGGFTGVVTFTVSGLPTGATGTFSPTSVTGSGSSTLTVQTAATTPTGSSTLTITGTSGTIVHTAAVTLVVNSSVAPTLVSIAVTPANSSIAAGGTQQYTATGTYSDSSTQNLTSTATWSSSTTATATISTAGLATAVAAGSTTIKATSGAISGSTGLTVTATIAGLVGHWTFDAGSGATAVDSSGNNYNLTLTNGVSWIPGKIGDAISTNGTTQSASSPSINLSGTNAVTVSMWVNRTYTSGGTTGDVLMEFSSNYNYGDDTFGFFPDEAPDCGTSAMEIGLDGNVGYNIKCFAQPTSGVWHHLAVVYDKSQTAANEVNLYVDGVLQTALLQTYSANNTNNFGTYPLYLFARGGTQAYSAAEMDDLQLYNVALTAAQIQQIYNSAAAGFTMAATPASQTVIQGASTTYTPTVTATGGFTGAVTFAVSGLPTGATGTFSPTSVTGSGSSTLTVQTASTTPTGSYPLTITGTSGTLVQTAATTLVVSSPANFTLAATPASQTVVLGGGTTYTPTVTATGGFTGTVAFTVSGLPTGTTGTFSPTSVTGSGSSTLTVQTSSTTPTGSYTLTITGTSGSLVQTTTTTLVVNPVASFTMTATPTSQTVVQGASTTYTPTVTATGGFTGAVTFTVSGLPTGATGTFSPTSVTGSGSSTLTIQTAATTPTGSSTVTITGTSGSIVQTSTVTLVVNAAPNFTLAATPASQTVIQGASTTYTPAVTATGGFTGAVTFTVSGLPTGATGTFSPTSVTGSGSSTLTVQTVATTPTGSSTLTITGTSGTLVHTATVTLVVNTSVAPTLVSIAVTPATPSILMGATQQFTATGTYSDSSTQNLTSSATWSSSGTTIATISTGGLATAVAAGTTTIKATSGAISGSTSLTVTATLSGLVGHWTFNAGSGTTAVDSSGNGYTATLTNGMPWVAGKFGDAISANGTTQSASTPSINLSSTNAVSFSVWLNRTYATGQDAMLEFSSNFNSVTDAFGFFPDESVDCGVTAMEISLQGNAGYNIKCYTPPSSGVWHNIVVVYDKSQTAANEITLYIDGVAQTAIKQTYSANNTNNFGTYPLYMFSRAGTVGYASGEMDDLQLFNRALSATDVQTIYTGAE